MRNLKKFLALVLAMMMTLSLMVTVNAASDFTDADNVNEKFTEAVNVLEGMGVFEGYADGSFQPKGNITRAEVATIVYRLATGDAEGKQAHLWEAAAAKFTDVSDDHWALGAIGYCANNLLVLGYDDGTFGPNKNVSGIEALAMILRAVGYGKNNEFKGWGWDTNVYGVARGEGLLKNVDNTNYASRLSQPATRELVAEVLFQAAQIPTVNYQYGSYNKYNNLITQDKEHENPSLGLQNYGLTEVSRIVLGNQATGESGTLLGTEGGSITTANGDGSGTITTPYSEYAYPGVTLDTEGTTATDPAVDHKVPAGIKLDYKSNLGLFGHRVHVWYNANANSGGAGLYKTYALTDKAELSAVVKADSTSKLSESASTNTGKLGLAAVSAGFAKAVAGDTYYVSASFSRIGGGNDSTAAYDAATDANTSTVFALISNNGNKKVDVVIPVVLDVGEISQVNNQADTKTLIVDGATNAGLNTAQEQADVMNPEAIKLGNTVVATKITRNTADDTGPVYWLDTPTETVEKTVVAYDSGTQKITFSDGTTLKRTIIDNTHLVSGDINVNTLTTLENAKYIVTLDMQGNWLNAVRSYDNNFVYGTYLDWSTTLGSSAFTYRLVGVDMNGEAVNYDITKWKQADGTLKVLGKQHGEDVPDVGMPYRDDETSAGVTGVAGRKDEANAPVYMGFMMNGKVASNADKDLYTVAGIQSFGDEETAYVPDAVDFKSNIDAGMEIKPADLKLGVKLIPETAPGTGAINLYLTENTKFIVVDGYGTDTLEPTVYEGLTKFLGESGSVTIKTKSANTDLADEILYTSSPYIYANTGSSAREVKTVFIPASCITRTGTSSMYYFPNKSVTFDSNGSGAKLYTAYQNGEEVKVWLEGTSTAYTGGMSSADYVETLITADPNADPKYGSFQNLEPTADKAADGQTIYKLSTAPEDGWGAGKVVHTGASYAGVTFKGTTNNGLTGILNDGTDRIVGTANVKVVNLMDGYTIEDINHLNDVASVKTTVTVVVAYAEAGSAQLATIYVVDIA